MKKLLLATWTLGLLASLAACDSKSSAHGFCMGDDGTAQDCTICCDVDKAKECCEKAEKLKAAAK